LKVLLLAAGLGTRLKPITNEIPKCLVPINGRPLLDYWLEMLTEAGLRDILINLHYFPDKVTTYLKGSRYADIARTVFETDLLGTGGTLVANADYFCGSQVMMIHADNLSRFDVLAYLKAHNSRPHDTAMTMMTFRTDAPETCGIVALDARGVVTNFYEKIENPPGNLANGAVYILEPEVLEYAKSLGKSFVDFSLDIIPAFQSKIYTWENKVYHRDIGNLESYRRGQVEFANLA